MDVRTTVTRNGRTGGLSRMLAGRTSSGLSGMPPGSPPGAAPESALGRGPWPSAPSILPNIGHLQQASSTIRHASHPPNPLTGLTPCFGGRSNAGSKSAAYAGERVLEPAFQSPVTLLFCDLWPIATQPRTRVLTLCQLVTLLQSPAQPGALRVRPKPRRRLMAVILWART